jgi:D-serine deaminase-like pyridoxal phosphate-dependent protein
VRDYGYGLVLDLDGRPSLGMSLVRKAYQEHGVIELDPAQAGEWPIGARVRIAPNHVCMTAAAHDRYFVVDGERRVLAIWRRVNGW